jgi:hypothetical protein
MFWTIRYIIYNGDGNQMIKEKNFPVREELSEWIKANTESIQAILAIREEKLDW